MTPEARAAFLEVHKGLPRAGPGCAADVHWAVQSIGLRGAIDVFEAGCGPGGDLVTLAQALPEARILAVDQVGQFIDLAARRAAAFGPRVTARVGDMAAPHGQYDLIWCAGALYFLGVTEIDRWRAARDLIAYALLIVAPA